MPLNIKYLIIIDILLAIGILLFRSALKPALRDMIGPRQIILTLLTPAVGLFCGNVFVFDAYLAAAVGLTPRTREEVAGTYIMMLPMVPSLDVETGVGGVYLFAISAIFSMNFGAIIGVLLTAKQRDFSRSSLDICALLLTSIEIYISLMDSGLTPTSLFRSIMLNFVGVGGPYLLLSRAIYTRRVLDKFFVRMIFSGILCAIIAVAQARLHWTLYEAINTSLHTPLPAGPAALSMRGGLLRTGGTMIDYSAGGMFLACVLVVFAGMQTRFRPMWSIAIGGVLIAGLFVTQSRGAWVAMIAGWLAIMFYRGFFARGALVAGALVFLQLLVVPFLASFSTKLGETFGANGGSTGTVEYRSRLFDEGLQQIASHPLRGQTPDQLRAAMNDMVQGQHIVDFVNTHLFVAMTTGLLGFAAWAYLWSMPIAMTLTNRPGRRSAKVIDPAELPLALIVSAMVCLVFTSAVDRNLTWPVIALGLLGPCLALRKMANSTSVVSGAPA